VSTVKKMDKVDRPDADKSEWISHGSRHPSLRFKEEGLPISNKRKRLALKPNKYPERSICPISDWMINNSLIVDNREHLLREITVTGASSSIIHEAYTSSPSSKQITLIQPPGIHVQWIINLLQLKLGYACDIFTPRVQSQETNMLFLGVSCI
jgi:hypothetical protein